MGEIPPFLTLSSPAAVAVAGLFGAVTGSFLNVCIVRVPQGKSIAFPASHCPHCQIPIRPFDNIPIVSYFLLRRACRSCRVRISPRYPLVELLTAALALALWWKFVVADPSGATAVRLARFACYFAFTSVLIVLSFINRDTNLLPDVITLPAIPVFFLAAFSTHGAGWGARLVGAAAGYLIFRLISDFVLPRFPTLKGETLGLGDGKLLALIGAVLGGPPLPFVVFGGAIAGAGLSLPVLAWRRRRVGAAEPPGRLQISLVPFLSIAALAYLFGAQQILWAWLAPQ